MFHDRSTKEWLAWRQLCKQLEKLTVTVNDDTSKPLICAIKLWGERLHQLRLQNPQYDIDALEECIDSYQEHIIDNGDP